MSTNREANLVLMAHWARAWTTLGRWQALNSQLSKAPDRRSALGPERRSASWGDPRAAGSATAR